MKFIVKLDSEAGNGVNIADREHGFEGPLAFAEAAQFLAEMDFQGEIFELTRDGNGVDYYAEITLCTSCFRKIEEMAGDGFNGVCGSCMDKGVTDGQIVREEASL